MHKSIQLRWFEQAEAKPGRQLVRFRRSASDPHANIVRTTTGPVRSDRRRVLTQALNHAVTAVRSLPAATQVWAKVAFRPSPTPSLEDDDRVLVAVLITDIVDSTKWAAEMGDYDWRALLDRHQVATRYQIKRFGGREVGNLGDGFVGIFGSPSRAVRCALAINNAIAPLGMSLRSGVHAGEVHLKDGQISGIVVHIAARIAATAHPGEARVSRTVRDLMVGSGLLFEDRGTHRLRGLPEELQLYAMPSLVGQPTNASVVR